jgi:secreted PhoX family phosphatase
MRRSAMTGGAFSLQALFARDLLAASSRSSLIAAEGEGAYGPLNPARSKNTDEALLALPEGFYYTVIGKAGAVMTGGNPTPRGHDGMAAFAGKGHIRLVRNHEINNLVGTQPVAFGNKAHAYDGKAAGGTTTLLVDPKTREIIKDFVSLSGTLQNCAGGPTPWNSWISCEETVLGKTKVTDSQGRSFGAFDENHGYCFEVPALGDTQVKPTPLKQMGRFVHEAIAVDPATGIVYETEDQGTAGFYRFIPNKKGKLAEGGRLQMLAVKNQPKYDTRKGQKVGAQLPASWVDIDDPDPSEADSTALAVYNQGMAKGAATFTRLEGCWYGHNRIFFNSTSGGDMRLGQVWEYLPVDKSSGYLTLLFESPRADVLEMPDNLCVSPRGGLALCEDGKNEQFIRGLTRKGQVFEFARNIVPGYERMEFAGATFSPDGETLFVNIQTPGLTFAIWGPWKRGAL